MSNDNDAASNDPANSNEPASVPAESGYGSPTPEDEMPPSKTEDSSSSSPESGESSEPAEKGDEYPLEAPSTDAPVEEGNAEAARSGRESFSSEPNDEASGA
ncbi:hypothetical protein [Arthrobacter sp. H35-D1]|uniref:hypothetical protein n=1 Tax=Arthrobacter sp. H35-D1 TaxID=3046202 RepID=UPI0024B8D33F|nr:hypothetical protein [Arthrobacter sp. H35-D1]MDJ0314898.1 hypothetical protein [Arthrobacter sp. H35-D1]